MQAFYEALTKRSFVGDSLYRVRDLTCLRVDANFHLVFACDSLGGIGQKPLDQVCATPQTVGHFSLRVPLLEVMAAGATPFLIIDTLSIEAGGYGQAILAEMKALAAEVGLSDPVHFTGSMEKNLVPLQTGVGVTVVGIAAAAHFQVNTACAGDVLLLVGLPKSAPKHEVRIGDPEIVSLRELQWLRAKPGIHDIVPVGSQGVANEARQLAVHTKLQPALAPAVLEDDQSGGPHTSVLVACSRSVVAELKQTLSCPVLLVGELRETEENC